MNDATTRELIGIRADAALDQAEAVQAMIAWDEPAATPVPGGLTSVSPSPMQPIERAPLSRAFEPDNLVLTTHATCVAPGVAVREVRPPLTELSPIGVSGSAETSSSSEDSPEDLPISFEIPRVDEPPPGKPLSEVLLKRRSALDFLRVPISRDILVTINRLAFRTKTFYPLMPAEAHVALVRPMWALHDVTGLDNGVWYYHPPSDEWTRLAAQDFRMEIQYLAMEQPMCGNASAVCFLCAKLDELMNHAGPDVYRLAHIEAGLAAQRISLAAAAVDLTCAGVGAFYDEELRAFLGMEQTDWQVLFAVALGVPLEPGQSQPIQADAGDDDGASPAWVD